MPYRGCEQVVVYKHSHRPIVAGVIEILLITHNLDAEFGEVLSVLPGKVVTVVVIVFNKFGDERRSSYVAFRGGNVHLAEALERLIGEINAHLRIALHAKFARAVNRRARDPVNSGIS